MLAVYVTVLLYVFYQHLIRETQKVDVPVGFVWYCPLKIQFNQPPVENSSSCLTADASGILLKMFQLVERLKNFQKAVVSNVWLVGWHTHPQPPIKNLLSSPKARTTVF